MSAMSLQIRLRSWRALKSRIPALGANNIFCFDPKNDRRPFETAGFGSDIIAPLARIGSKGRSVQLKNPLAVWSDGWKHAAGSGPGAKGILFYLLTSL